MITVPKGTEPYVTIESTLNSRLGWVEANTYGTISVSVGDSDKPTNGSNSGDSSGGGYAKVEASAHLLIYANGNMISPNPVTLESAQVSGQDQVYFQFMLNVGSVLSANVNLPTGGPYEITVEEIVTLVAKGSDGHAYISGGFTWDPLAVEIREGCRSKLMPIKWITHA